ADIGLLAGLPGQTGITHAAIVKAETGIPADDARTIEGERSEVVKTEAVEDAVQVDRSPEVLLCKLPTDGTRIKIPSFYSKGGIFIPPGGSFDEIFVVVVVGKPAEGRKQVVLAKREARLNGGRVAGLDDRECRVRQYRPAETITGGHTPLLFVTRQERDVVIFTKGVIELDRIVPYPLLQLA